MAAAVVAALGWRPAFLGVAVFLVTPPAETLGLSPRRGRRVVAASAGNLLEGLVKLGRHCMCVFVFGERRVSYEREKLATGL